MQRTDSVEKTLMLGKIEEGRRGWQRMRWLDGLTDMSLAKLQELVIGRKPCVLQSMGSQRVGHDWATELNFFSPSVQCYLDNYIILNRILLLNIFKTPLFDYLSLTHDLSLTLICFRSDNIHNFSFPFQIKYANFTFAARNCTMYSYFLTLVLKKKMQPMLTSNYLKFLNFSLSKYLRKVS